MKGTCLENNQILKKKNILLCFQIGGLMWPHLMLIGLRMAIQSNTDAHNDDRSNYGASFLISVSHCHFRVCLRGIYLHVWRSWAKETYSVATVEWQTEWYSNARNLNEMLRREGDILILPLHLLSPPTPHPHLHLQLLHSLHSFLLHLRKCFSFFRTCLDNRRAIKRRCRLQFPLL